MKRSIGDKAFTVANCTVLALLGLLCIYPLYYVLVASFSDPDRLAANSGMLLYPLGFTLGGYKIVFAHPLLLTSYRNTFLYVLTITLSQLVMDATGAYVLSRRNARLVPYIMKFMVVTMFVGAGLIPLYILVSSMGLVGSPLSLVVLSLYSAYNIILLRTAFSGIPDSLEESARLDGAGDLRILFQIYVPLSKATLAVLALLIAVGVWNGWFNPMVFLATNQQAYPLALVLREVLILNNLDSGSSQMHSITQLNADMYKRLAQYAIVVVAVVPIMCLYPFLQKYFVKGVMLGSLKG